MTQILFVDDDANVLQALQRTLRDRYDCDVATSGAEGLARLGGKDQFGVVVSDMRMPGMNGIEFLRNVKERAPDTVRVMLTGHSDLATAIEAVNEGSIFRFVTKPCPADQLRATLDAAIRQFRLITAERQLLENTLGGCIRVLTEILSMTDLRSFARCASLQETAREVSRALRVAEAWEIEAAAMLAPIGSVAIPPGVIVRARAAKTLTGPEKDMLARVPDIGHDLLAAIPRMAGVAEIVKYQNKCFDGSGYPHDGVAGEQIPFGARLLHILVDLASLRQDGQAPAAAFAQLRARAGEHDPQLLAKVEAALSASDRAPVATDSRAVAVRELRSGDVLARDVHAKDNSVLVAAGQRLSGTVLERLRNFASTTGVLEPVHVLREPAPARSTR